MAVECPEGPHVGVWRKAFLFEGAGGTTVTVVEVSGKLDPAIEASIGAMLTEGASSASR